MTNCFRGYRWAWHLLAIAITFVVVVSGFDWYYFEITRSPVLHKWLFPAAIIGGLLPVLGPLGMLLIGKLQKNARLINAAWALGQAVMLGWIISSLYKSFTGRIPPEMIATSIEDVSRGFQFGFLRGGIFWGWPSSHTTIAFAMACTLVILCRHQKKVWIPALLYALYIGVGISTTIHWFSEFAAGMIIGSVIGIAVGTSFEHRHFGADVKA